MNKLVKNGRWVLLTNRLQFLASFTPVTGEFVNVYILNMFSARINLNKIFTTFYNCPFKLFSGYSAHGRRGIGGSGLGSFDFIRYLCQILNEHLNLKVKNVKRKHNK